MFHWCDMFRPKSRLSSGTTSCIKSKKGIGKICLIGIEISILRCFYHVAIHVWFYIKTVIEIVKIGKRDIMLLMVKWAIQRVISCLCGVQRGPVRNGIQ